MPSKPRADPGKPADPTIEELKLELAKTQERLAATERERDALAARLEALSAKFDELQQQYTSQQAELGRLKQVEAASDELRQDRDNLRAERDALITDRDGLRVQLDALRTDRDNLQAERDALRTDRDNLKAERDALTTERDGLRADLDQVHGAIPDQVRTQLDSRLGEVNQAHNDEVQALQTDRDRLQTRITELEQTAQAADAPAMTTSDLASHFADVLNELGNRPPAAGESFAAALTGLNIQAKGLLRTNDQGAVEILTAQAASAPADQLSTVQMELKLLPRLQPPPPAAPPVAEPQ